MLDSLTEAKVQSDIGEVRLSPQGFDRIEASGKIDRIGHYYAVLVRQPSGMWSVDKVSGHRYNYVGRARYHDDLTHNQRNRIINALPRCVAAWAASPASYDVIGQGEIKHKTERLEYLKNDLPRLQKNLYTAQTALSDAEAEIAQLKEFFGVTDVPDKQ